MKITNWRNLWLGYKFNFIFEYDFRPNLGRMYNSKIGRSPSTLMQHNVTVRARSRSCFTSCRWRVPLVESESSRAHDQCIFCRFSVTQTEWANSTTYIWARHSPQKINRFMCRMISARSFGIGQSTIAALPAFWSTPCDKRGHEVFWIVAAHERTRGR